MRLRPVPDRLLRGYTLCDFESRSRANLKAVGGRLYWADPSTEAICAVLYHVRPDGAGRWYLWTPGDPPPRLEYAVAHNASNFDRFGGDRCGWRVENPWLDSASAARRAGLPGALDVLGKRWLGRDKDKAGNRFTLALSRPSRAKATKGQLPPITPEALARVVAYCASDVEIMVKAWPRLKPWLDEDRDVCEVDRIINDRGMCLDLDMVRALQRQIRRQQDDAVRKAAKALRQTPAETRAQAMSPVKFTAATGLPNAQAETVKAALRSSDAHPLCAVRAALASVVPGKLKAAINRTEADGRMRDALYYFGGHTGRWSSKGMQVHNLPRVGFEDEAKKIGWECNDYVEVLAAAAKDDDSGIDKKEVSGLLRACIVAARGRVLCVLDYSGIEARVNAWAAGDEDALAVFRAQDAGTGPDPYRVMAARVFGVPVCGMLAEITKEQRGLGKIAELMLGYGAGHVKFAESCADQGANLAALDIDARDVVSTWREVHSPIVQNNWRASERAFRAAVNGGSGRAGAWRYEKRGKDVACVLPSGRVIMYNNAKARRVMREADDGRKYAAWDLTYLGGRPFPVHTYGGSLTENAVQAISSDLLRDALLRCEREGLRPILHVHDEIVTEPRASRGKEVLERMRVIMTSPPRWARGLPMHTAGFVSSRYRK